MMAMTAMTQGESLTENTPVSTYYEAAIGNTLYRVTNVYLGQIELGEALENLTVSKALQATGSSMEAYG